MRIKSATLAGRQLDAAVALAEGGTNLQYDGICTWFVEIGLQDRALSKSWAQAFTPSSDWAHGGPIIERERLHLIPLVNPSHGEPWHCSTIIHSDAGVPSYAEDGLTPLIAAMRCYVASKLGDEVELPDGLEV